MKKVEIVILPNEGEYTLIGLAEWDKNAMKSFEVFSHQTGNLATAGVFNLDDFTSAFELEKLLPRVKQLFNSPLVVGYNNGKPTQKLEGKAAREWLEMTASTGK